MAAAQRVNETLQKVDEALTSGVDDVAAGEHLELARRGGKGLARRHQPAVHELGQILVVRTPAELVRPRAQHREDGALARILQGGIRGLGAAHRRGRELQAVGLAEPFHRRGEAVQKLGEDRPGVAAGAVEGAVGGCPGGVADGVGSLAPQPRGRRPQRRRQVGAGVRVTDREDVDAVQALLLAHHGERARAHHAREHGPTQLRRVVGALAHVPARIIMLPSSVSQGFFPCVDPVVVSPCPEVRRPASVTCARRRPRTGPRRREQAATCRWPQGLRSCPAPPR